MITSSVKFKLALKNIWFLYDKEAVRVRKILRILVQTWMIERWCSQIINCTVKCTGTYPFNYTYNTLPLVPELIKVILSSFMNFKSTMVNTFDPSKHNDNRLTVHYLKTRRSSCNNLLINYTNDVRRKSCEQELITRKCIATHTNHFYSLNRLLL